MRNELYKFRHSKRMSQQAMANKIGYSRVMYAYIESGRNNGSLKFWNVLQKKFNLSDEQKGVLMRDE